MRRVCTAGAPRAAWPGNVGQLSLRVPCSLLCVQPRACLEASFLWVDCASNTVTTTWRKALDRMQWRVGRGVDRGLWRNPSAGPDTFGLGGFFWLYFSCLAGGSVVNKSEVLFLSEVPEAPVSSEEE